MQLGSGRTAVDQVAVIWSSAINGYPQRATWRISLVPAVASYFERQPSAPAPPKTPI